MESNSGCNQTTAWRESDLFHYEYVYRHELEDTKPFNFAHLIRHDAYCPITLSY